MNHGLFLSACLLIAGCYAPRLSVQKNAVAKTTTIAHRGAFKKNGFPENSIASLNEAKRLGCWGSEFDVRMTADDSLIINHDPNYRNMPIEKTLYSELIRQPLSNGEKLPTLREYVLAGLQNGSSTKLICEIKPSDLGETRARLIAQKVYQLFDVMDAQHKVVYISFDYTILKAILALHPKAVTQYLNGDKAPQTLKDDGVAGADYHFSVFQKNPDWVQQAKKLGIALNAWTVNDPLQMDWLLANGFDFITTNEPELLFEREKLALTAKGWRLVWSDEFGYGGFPDSSKWSYDAGTGCPDVCGWGNNELQYYTVADTNNALVQNGSLFIKARKQPIGNSPYTSARLVTKHKGDWLYGRLEVRAKLPAGKGLWPAVWMLPTDWAYGGWPASGELDIMENVGYYADSIYGTVHTQKFNHAIGTQVSKALFVKDPQQQFHVYAAEWSKEKITISVDDTVYFEFANTGKGYADWPFNKRMHLLLNIAVGGDWGGKFGVDDTVFPQAMEVDYVRVYQRVKP